jgi:cytochrome c2
MIGLLDRFTLPLREGLVGALDLVNTISILTVLLLYGTLLCLQTVPLILIWKVKEGEFLYNYIRSKLLENKVTLIILGVISPIVIIIGYAQFFKGTNSPAIQHLFISGVFLYLALFIFFVSSSVIGRILDSLLILLGFLFLANGFGFSADPSIWPFFRDFYDVYSWNLIPRFLLILSLSLGFSLSFFLFLLSFLPKRAWETSHEGSKTFTFFSLLVLLPVPLFALWNLYTLTKLAKSDTSILLAFAFVPLSALLLLFLSGVLLGKMRQVFPALLLSVAQILLFSYLAQVERNNAIRERIVILTEMKPQKIEEKKPSHEELLAMGERVFKKRCSACHSFEKRVVGPPFLQVLPKYVGAKDELMAFIKNPRKINPGYPRMPQLRLREEEIRAVVTFLLQEIERRKEK